MRPASFASVVRPKATAHAARTSRWNDGLRRLGLEVPEAMVADCGLLLSVPRAELDLRVPAVGEDPVVHEYAGCLRRLLDHPAAEDIRLQKPSDDMLVLVLAKLLAPAGASANVSRTHRDASALTAFVRSFPCIEVSLDVLELDTLRLMQAQGGSTSGIEGAHALGALVQVDALAALDSADASDVVRFSLELLPSVLEDSRRMSPGTYALGGYQGLTRHAAIDSLVPSELAWPDDEFARRLLEDEVVYYARERSENAAPRVHLVLVDASASMRGNRSTFARGVAIALVRKLELAGEESRIRFFDGRLYEPVAVQLGSRRLCAAAVLPHVLSFRGERGRSPERVLRQLVVELDLVRARDHRSPVVHLLTHAAFYAPRSLVAEVRARASFHAAFMVPDGPASPSPPIELDWLDLLDSWTIVDSASLVSGHSRTVRAREVVARLEGTTSGPRSSAHHTSRAPGSSAEPSSRHPSSERSR